MAKDLAANPPLVARGGFVARLAGADDLIRAQHLRHLCFVEGAGRAPLPDGVETDAFDALCDHVIVEDPTGQIVCCYRVMGFAAGRDILDSYSAQFYDLSAFAQTDGPMIELGRFCVSPDAGHPDVLRLAWAALAALVDRRGARMLFGCSSFAGMDPSLYRSAFDLLAARHLPRAGVRPGVKAPVVIRYAANAKPVQDRLQALAQLPSLLKTYLTMGGWVSDHAVVDADMNTLHVFTGLEIAAIPPARAAALRALVVDAVSVNGSA